MSKETKHVEIREEHDRVDLTTAAFKAQSVAFDDLVATRTDF